MKKHSIPQLKWLLAVAAASGATFAPLSNAALEEVVVTAQRSEKSLFDTPVAVSAYSAEALEQAGVDDISDFNAANPSFMATPFLSDPLGNAPIRIRGIGTGGGNPGFEGAVGLYVDEVYRSRTGSALLTFFDMEGVEILRGPQGTLFGKNTTAGALLQRTAAPVIGEDTASARYSVGNYGTRKLDGHINISSSDSSAFRIAALYEDTDGWFENAVTGENTFWRENRALRGSYKFEPTDTFSGRVILDWSSMESPGNYGTSTRLLNNVDTDGDIYAGRQVFFGRLAEDQTSGGLGTWYDNPGFDPYNRNVRPSRNGEYELKQRGATIHLNFDLTDNMSLRSITGWRKIQSESLNGDWDFSPTAIGGILNQIYDFETFSQEFILDGDVEFGDGASLDYVAGVNYFTEDVGYLRQAAVGDQFSNWIAFAGDLGDLEDIRDAAITAAAGNQALIDTANNDFAAALNGLAAVYPTNLSIPFLGNPDFLFQDVNFDQTEDSYGVFGHATFEILDSLSFIAGARFNRIEKDFDLDNRFPGTSEEYHDAVLGNIFGFYAVGAALMSPDYSAERSDEEWTYNAALQFRPTDALQLYAGYSRGFKSGGFNLNEDAVDGVPCDEDAPPAPSACIDPDLDGRFFRDVDPDKAEFDPEFVDSYEIGARWDISDSARVGATLFYADYDDLQVATFTGLTFLVVNAGSSTTEGLELEGEFAITDYVTLTAGATFMKAEYGDDVVGLPAGRRRGQTPDEAAVLGVRTYLPLGGDLELYANGNLTYQSEMYLAEGVTGSPLSEATQDEYFLFGATFGLRVADDWDVNIFCNNCFDEDYYEWAFNQPFHNALMANPAPPMTYGISFKKNYFH